MINRYKDLIKIAQTFLEEEEYRDSAVVYEAVISFGVFDKSTLFSLATCYERLSLFEEEERVLRLCCAHYAEDMQSHANHVASLIKLKRYRHARSIIDRFISDDKEFPEKPLLHYFSCTIQSHQMGSFSSAIENWKNSYQSYPHYFPIMLGYAKALLESDCNAESLYILTKILSAGERHCGVYEYFSKANVRLNTDKKSILNSINCLNDALLFDLDSHTEKSLVASKILLHSFCKDFDAVLEILRSLSYLSSKAIDYVMHSVKSVIQTSPILSFPHDYSWSVSGVAYYENIILKSINSKQPFSMVRLGDGEGLVLSGANDNLLGATSTSLCRNLELNKSDKINIIEQINNSIKSADLLGLPSPYQIITSSSSNPFASTIEFLPVSLDDFESRGGVILDSMSHYHFWWSGLINRLLQNRDFVGYISTHDIDSYLQGLGVKSIGRYLIPGEEMYDLNISTKPHYPDCFNEIKSDLQVPYKGAVFVVGAGLLGKIYCNLIKDRGGVALDIGAVMDLIKGLTYTRVTTRANINSGYSKLGCHV